MAINRKIEEAMMQCELFMLDLQEAENKNLENSDLVNDVFKREIASILRCDLSPIISEFEMNMLKNQFKIDEKHQMLYYKTNKQTSNK